MDRRQITCSWGESAARFMPGLTASRIHFDLPVISLAEQRLTNEEYRRFQAVMQPTVARYVYNTVSQKLTTLLLQQRWPDLFGPAPEQTQAGERPPGAPTAQAKDGPASAPEGAATPRAQADVARGSPGETEGEGGGGGKPTAENKAGEWGWWTPPFLMRYSYNVAELTRHNYRRFRAGEEARQLQRGQLVLTGIVEAKCAAGFALLDVRANYDPVGDNITFISVAPRTVKVYDQWPRG
jgi:hypothetical protein